MQFKIHAKRITGEKQVFLYDNEKSLLTTETGFAFSADVTGAPSYGRDSHAFGKDAPAKKTADVRLLKIQLGLSCNYSCDYCSQRFVERPKETSKKDIEEFMSKLNNLNFDEERGVKIELWGGEPLVYWKTVKPLVEALQEKFSSWKKKPRYSMITNGSILTPEIAFWLMANDFFVAISHDGPGQATRGPDPFDEPEKKKLILDMWRQLHRQGRMSFNSMLTSTNYSRKEIYDWFVALTGDEDVKLGEGAMVDAYDDGGMANLLDTKAKHFAFRKKSFNDIYANDGNIGFNGIIQKIDNFTNSILTHTPASKVGQKCGMDMDDSIAVDLRGNILTCQNTSAEQMAPNGESHKIGHLSDVSSAKLSSATHWRNREHCSSCPVLHLCQGSCMFNEGDNWTATCATTYSDHVALFALSLEKVTGGFVPYLIEGGNLPLERADIWGDLYEHPEAPPARKAFPVKVVASKEIVEGVEVFTKSETVHA